MRSLLRGVVRLLPLLTLALPSALPAQETRRLAGVVVDAGTGAPVGDVLVAIEGTALGVLTDAEGRFALGGVPVGRVRLVLRHVGYGEHTRPLDVAAEGALDFHVRISSRAIELSPLVVAVDSDDARARRASGNATHVIERADIDRFALSGGTLHALLASRVPSLRDVGGCLEYRLQAYTPPSPDPDDPALSVGFGCRDVAVYVDGMPNPRGSTVLALMSPHEIERLQVLSPGEAGVRYPDASGGVILIETRQGAAAPFAGARVHVTGLGWSEPEPYRWLRVLGVSTAGSGVVAGLAYAGFSGCAGDDAPVRAVRCDAMVRVAGALATSLIGGAITRRAGRTAFSEGRLVPSLLAGAATASVGYALQRRGDRADSGGSSAAGLVVLGVGLPAVLTLSDRLFRVLR